jgi:hypothetical protein
MSHDARPPVPDRASLDAEQVIGAPTATSGVGRASPAWKRVLLRGAYWTPVIVPMVL